jgi:pimeloyl-ACP methyl ester carboxylesterase
MLTPRLPNPEEVSHSVLRHGEDEATAARVLGDAPAVETTRPASGSRGLPNPLGMAAALWSGAQCVGRDPRLAGVLRAGPRVGMFLSRSAGRSARAPEDDTVVPVRPTPVLALQAYVDEVMIALFHHPDLVPSTDDFAPAAADLAAARELLAARGWLDDPASYHRDPPPPDDLRAWHGRAIGLGYEHITFTSGWEPDEEEPGRDRWLSHEANRIEHAWVSRAPGREHTSWLVCAHGFGMGSNAFVDLRAFRTPELHRKGVNVVVPVMPLHGPRASGRVRGEDLMTIDLVDSMHGMAQATWDLRRTIRWLRATQGAERIGLIGYSLGALVVSLVASLEDDLACVIAGIPVVDLPDLFRRHSRPGITRLADEYGVLGNAADDVHRVVSPLAMTCKVPFDRRFVFGGLADRMSTFGHTRRLWLHWGRPALAAYPGGHVGFFWSSAARRLVDEAVDASLL